VLTDTTPHRGDSIFAGPPSARARGLAGCATLVAVPSSTTASEAARVDALLRLFKVVAHDLSNPLQALGMHAEMGLEDASPGSDAAAEREADVVAVRRMRRLLRGMTELAAAGSGPREVPQLLSRFSDLSARRWEQLGVGLAVEAHDLRGTLVSLHAEEVLLAIGLTLASEIAGDPPRGTTLALVGRREGATARVHLHATADDALAAGLRRTAPSVVERVQPLAMGLSVRAVGPAIEVTIPIVTGGTA
jgi:signal transduction histidine kinase